MLPSYSHLFASLLFFSLLVLFRRFIWCWMYCRGSTGHIDGIAVLSLRRIPWYAVSSLCWQPQLLINSTRFPLPWDIGTPRHWKPESKHRDIGTSGHWNPRCTGRRKGTDPRTGKGHRPEERFSLFRYPLGSHWRSLRCAFHCRAAHGAYDVLGGARWLQVQFLVSLFPRLLRGGACPSLWVANFSNTVYWGTFVSSTQPVRACGWWSLI